MSCQSSALWCHSSAASGNVTSLHGHPGVCAEMQDGMQCHRTAMFNRTGTLRWGARRSPGRQMQACIVLVSHCHRLLRQQVCCSARRSPRGVCLGCWVVCSSPAGMGCLDSCCCVCGTPVPPLVPSTREGVCLCPVCPSQGVAAASPGDWRAHSEPSLMPSAASDARLAAGCQAPDRGCALCCPGSAWVPSSCRWRGAPATCPAESGRTAQASAGSGSDSKDGFAVGPAARLLARLPGRGMLRPSPLGAATCLP